MTWRGLFRLLKETATQFQQDRASLLSGAIAFFSLLSLAPLLLLTVIIAGFVFGDQASHRAIVSRTANFVGDAPAETVDALLVALRDQQGSGWSAILGGAIMIYGASRVFMKLQEALNAVWNVREKAQGNLKGKIKLVFQKRLLSFTMILLSGVLLLLSMFAKAAISGLDKLASPLLPQISWLWHLVDLGASVVLATVLFAAIFRTLPDVKISWGDVWLGAAITATLFTLGSLAIGVYLGYSGTASVYGAMGSLVAILLWSYFSANAFFFGAELTQVYAVHQGHGLHPEEHAEALEGMPTAPEHGDRVTEQNA